jgi:hypothetical protein
VALGAHGGEPRLALAQLLKPAELGGAGVVLMRHAMSSLG